MNRRHVPYVVGTIAAATLVVGVALAWSNAPGIDDGRPILVVGDSYAVGIAAALRRLYPGRAITSVAKGGVAAYYMQPVQETDGWVIVSAGTNDAAGGASPSEIADRVARVFGPYASCSPKRGAIAYIEPHTKMGGQLGSRVALVRDELERRGIDRMRCLAVIPMRPEPSPVDRIHFDPAGYETIAKDAIAGLAKLGA